jgi:uncharacterized repeat protein (TIGR02543 family)
MRTFANAAAPKFSIRKPLSIVAAVAIALVGAISPLATTSPASAVPVTTSIGTNPSTDLNAVVSSTTTLNSVLATANDLVITGYSAGDKIRVVVDASAGTQVQLTATTNLTSVTGYTLSTSATSQLGWISSQADANTALAGLKFIAGSTASTSSVTVTASYAGPSAGTGTYAYYAGTGHYYQYVSTTRTWVDAQADVANNPSTYTFNGLSGYLATVTSSGENDFINSRVGSAAVWLGARRDLTNARSGGDNAWYWTEGPEAGTKFFMQGTGTSGAPNGTNVGTNFNIWNNGEPNGTTTAGESALQLLSGGSGKWNDLQASDGSQNIGYVVEYGGMNGDTLTYSSVTRVLPITVTANQVVDANWTELNFDFANKVYVTGTGLNLNDKVRFKNVLTKGGICVDGVVTTKTISSATIKKYDTGTGAGGTAANFEADVDINAANGYAEFQFDFFTCDTYGTANQVRVVLQNVGVTAIDIDYYQWNELSNFDSYTMAADTKVFECLTSSISSGTCPASHPNPAISTFPASMRFQGPSSIDATIPQDQVVVNYGNIETFTIKFGRSASGTPNYFGVAFKGQPWGTATPATKGATSYNIVYNGNSSTGGSAPANQTGVTGTNFAISGNTGTLVRTGYTFSGWNTLANGSGTAYAAGANIMMPNGGTTLYAQWIAASFPLTYDANLGASAPAAEVRSAGATANLSSSAPTRTGYTFSGWNTLANGTGTSYASSASFTMPGSATTLYAQWSSSSGSLVYDTQGGSTAPTTQTGVQGTTATVTSTTPTKSGYTFVGWNTAANGTGTDYLAGSTYTFTSGSVTIYARWTPVLYTLTYNGNGATGVPAAGSAAGGQSLTLSTAYPTRTGYTCTAWSSSPTGTPTVSSPYTMPSANTTLYAVCAANTYTVAYNLNGGSTGSISTATGVTYLSSYTTSSGGNFAKSNYDLVGWTTSVDVNGDPIGSRYTLGAAFSMPAGNVTLYAVWVASTVEIRYDANGGIGGPATASATPASTYTISPSVPTRTGYTFAGWQASGGTPAGTFTTAGTNSFTVPVGHVTLVAQWTALTNNLTYNTSGGSAAPTDANNYGYLSAATVSSTVPTKTGYVFLGWNTAANGTGTSFTGGNSLIFQTSNVTLYAQWSGNPYVLTYNGNGGSSINPATETRLVDSTAAISSSLPTRTGYTFSGWNTAANGSGTAFAAGANLTMTGANLTLFAQWTINASGVSYDANGGSGAPAGANYNFGDPVTVSSTVPTKSGYTFTGWNTACNGSGTAYAPADAFSMPGSAVVLCAQWATNSYVLTYDGNGGSGVPNASGNTFGATVTVTSTIPTRTGYTFIAWNTLADATGTSRAASTNASPVTFTMPASNVTLYAIWSLNAYTLYYNMNGGVGSISAQPARYGSAVTVSSTTPTRVGYTFSGWNTDILGGGAAYAGAASLTMPANNVTLYAVWAAVSYTLTYDANSGTGAPAAATGLHLGDVATLSATVPTRTGYDFNGWNTAANGSGNTILGGAGYTMPAASVTLYALWSPSTNHLVYNANGGSGEPAGSASATGDTVTVSSTLPTRSGYDFTGWYTTASGTGGTAYAASTVGTPVTFTMPGSNVTLYAQWTAKSITLTYDLNGGSANAGASAPAAVTDYYNASILLAGSGPIGKANTSFLGWNTAADGSGTMYPAEGGYVMPASDVTLYAQWSPVFFVVEYISNGGNGQPGAQFAAAGENLNLTQVTPSLDGYEFAGWVELAQGNTYNSGSAITMPSTNVTMVASFRIRRATVYTPPVATPPTEEPGPTPPPVVEVAPLTVKERVFFKGDKSDLLPATIVALKKLIAIAKKRGVAASITIIGRVKETNDKSYDMKLSKARAVNVANYLKKAGLKGPFKVTAAGISPENRWVSRRVEITVVWSKK